MDDEKNGSGGFLKKLLVGIFLAAILALGKGVDNLARVGAKMSPKAIDEASTALDLPPSRVVPVSRSSDEAQSTSSSLNPIDAIGNAKSFSDAASTEAKLQQAQEHEEEHDQKVRKQN